MGQGLFEVTEYGTIRQIYGFLLVWHCNFSSIL